MNRLVTSTALVCLLLGTGSALAQRPDFSGMWTLDRDASEFSPPAFSGGRGGADVGRLFITHAKNGCVATSGLRRQDGPPLASTVPGPPSCPATIHSNGASSNPPSSSSAFGGTCGMP